MFTFIGLHIKYSLIDAGLIAASCIYGILILVTIISVLYQYHYDRIDETIYRSPFYLYNILSPIALLGLPLINDINLLFLIYAVPLGILLIIVILNRQDKIFTIKNVIFYVV